MTMFRIALLGLSLLAAPVGAQAATASIDEHNNLIVDGEPMLVLGAFDVYPLAELGKAKALGFNVVEVPFRRMDPRFPADRSAMDWSLYLEEAERLGLKVIPWFGGYGEDYLDRTLPLIEKYRDHPALIGWYSIDEPSGPGVGVESLETIYRAFKQADPQHVVVSVFHKLPGDLIFAPTVDVFGIDPYPIRNAGKPGGDVTDVVTETQEAMAGIGGSKPVWTCPQAFGVLSSWKRAPHADEYRVMTFLQFIHGVKGLLAYTWRFDESLPDAKAIWNDEGLQQGVRQTNEELQSIAPALLHGTRQTTVSGPIHMAVFTHDGHRTAVVANAEYAEAAAILQFTAETRAERIFGTANAGEGAGYVHLNLSPYAVYAVKLTGTGDVTLNHGEPD